MKQSRVANKKHLILLILILAGYMGCAQTNHSIAGPIGVYHVSPGYTYADSSGNDTILLEDEIRFGEMAISNQANDYGFDFAPDVDTCQAWNANRIFGIIQPPTELGIYSRPSDTALLAPIEQIDSPGMIQGGQRFSRLSQLYSGFAGVILDDWNHDTVITHKVHDAVKGRLVDDEGNVYSSCPETTPYNKLYCVIYSTAADPAAMPYVDGLSYWYWAYQNCCYTNLDSDINTLRANWPGKEILIGIYMSDSHLGWTDPASVQYLLKHALNRYDNGDINGVIIFRGPVLATTGITISQWNSYNVPSVLDSFYYPYIGAGQGKVLDCSSSNPLQGAFVNVFCKGWASGDTMMRSRQKADANGNYHFGLWAGNRNTDSTYYWLIAEKTGYVTDTIGFWIKRTSTTLIPDVSLCPQLASTPVNTSVNHLQLMPNPCNGVFKIQDVAETPGEELEVYDMQGQKVYAASQPCSCVPVDISAQASGLYLVLLRNADTKVTQKSMLVLEH